MLDPHSIVSNWLTRGGDVREPPPLVAAALRQIEREAQAEEGILGWDLAQLEHMLEMVDQGRLEFDEDDQHANVRMQVARYLETVVLPEVADPRIHKIIGRLREARQNGTVMWHPERQKFFTIWDAKANLPLLCPDDAREEAMRVQRRYLPHMLEWRNNGKSIHKAVFTLPNFQPGELHKGMEQIFARLKGVRKHFPQIRGMLAVLEAPLSADRTWNVHLNVFLLCDGWIEYEDLRRHWHWQLDIYRVRGGEDELESVFRELIKYPLQAISAKSEAHSQGGTSAAPAMVEWTAAEWLEWWAAHQRFRRTRSYGVLYGIGDPEPESMDGAVAVGFAWRDGDRLRRRVTLLDLIPADNSSGERLVERLRRELRRLLGPPDLPDRVRATLTEGMHAWQTVKHELK